MSRRTLLAATVVGLVALAVAAVIQTRHDEHRSGEALDAAWRSVGASLARPSLATVGDADGLECFVYRVMPAPRGLVLCLDDLGRLVEAIRQTGGAVSLTSVAIDPSRAPIRFPTSALAIARKVGSFNEATTHLETSLAACDSAVTVAHRRLTTKHPTVHRARHILFSISSTCAHEAANIRTSAAGQITTPLGKTLVAHLGKASIALSQLASAVANGLGDKPVVRAELRTALRLRFSLRVTRDELLRDIVQERRRLTGRHG